jgi:hypothetical protein
MVPLPGIVSTRPDARSAPITLVAVAIATFQSRTIARVDGAGWPSARRSSD